jgi:ABC-type Zn uptake system ZnuABC Zn-binding protein ZnuA
MVLGSISALIPKALTVGNSEATIAPEVASLRNLGTWIFLLAIAAIGTAGCTPLASDAGMEWLTSIDDLTEVQLLPDRRLRVVATTSIVGDVLANIAKDRVDLQILLPADADPHAYQPTPQDLTLIANADVVFINGLGLETFFEDILINTGGQAVVVSLSEGVQARAASPHSDDLDDSHDSDQAEPDAHVWLNPDNVAQWVDNAASALSALDPVRAAEYAASATAYRSSLDALNTWIIREVSQIPETDRKLVTDHLALGYFADRYGFDVVGAVIPSYSTAAEVSAQELAALQQAIRASGAKAVFVTIGTNPVVSERLADDLGLRVVQLYIGTLSDPDGPAATYLDLMYYNVTAIVNALVD